MGINSHHSILPKQTILEQHFNLSTSYFIQIILADERNNPVPVYPTRSLTSSM